MNLATFAEESGIARGMPTAVTGQGGNLCTVDIACMFQADARVVLAWSHFLVVAS